MISLCLFSKNRPMQLDLCLRSLVNAPYITDIKVLYLPEGQYSAGYDIVKQEYPNVNFIKEGDDFSGQILDIVKNNNEYFLWGTDDSIFCNKVELTPDKIDWVFNQQKAISIILRVGGEMTQQDHFQYNPSPPLPVIDTYKDMIAWDVLKCPENYDVGRPWQNDASIMPRDLYLERLSIETYWREHKSKSLDYTGNSGRVFNPCVAATFQKIAYVNIPVNLVHLSEDGKTLADFGNWGRQIRYDTAMLNELFLTGKRISLELLDTKNINCPRREMQFSVYDLESS